MTAEKKTPFTTKDVVAICREFSAIATTLTRRHTSVVPITSGREIGYTSNDNVIHLSFEDDIYKGKSKPAAFMVLRGVFSHELLHQLITKFSEYFKAIDEHSGFEKTLFADILNVCEDAAIEFFAPEYLSQEHIRALEYTRATLYKHQPPLHKQKDPFGQFFTALLQFRFWGFLKGHFTSKKAKKVFLQCVPVFCTAQEAPVQMDRIRCAAQITELSKPLWKDRADEYDALQKLMEELSKQFQMTKNSGSGKGSDESDPSSGSGSSLSKRQEKTMRKLLGKSTSTTTDSESGSGQAGAESPEPTGSKGSDGKRADKASPDSTSAGGKESPTPDSSDGKTPLPSGHPDKKDTQKGTGKDGEDSEDTEDTDGESSASSTDEESPSDEESSSDSGEESDSDKLPDDSGEEDGTSDTDPTSADQDSAAKELESDLVLSDEEISAIDEVHRKALEQEEKEAEEYSDTYDDIDFQPTSKGYHNVCAEYTGKNVRVHVTPTEKAKASYDDIVKQMASGIAMLTSRLARILRNRKEESIYKTSGRVSIKRLNCGRVTSRVFTKRRDPEHSEYAVVIAADISGSMRGDKIAHTRRACIALAETFAALRIPVYIFGFTAEWNGDPVHQHYVGWGNKKGERLNLLSLDASMDNFDGFSIRYATELLRKKEADKKLLFVISDGAPVAEPYNRIDGVQDTKLAISEANKVASTVGILLGGANPEIHREMYGYNFIHIKNVDDMFKTLGKTIAKFI